MLDQQKLLSSILFDNINEKQLFLYSRNYFPYNFNFFDLPEPTCTISA